jgi:intracellular septation protein
VFGVLTLALQDDVFIKMKVTLINLLFGLMLLGGRGSTGRCSDGARRLDHPGRRRLAQAVVALGLVFPRSGRPQRSSGGIATDIWVDFKVFRLLPLTLGFALLQAPRCSATPARGRAEDRRRRPFQR